jgi:RimJ/RimL family protein N-acetyltransferase
LSRALDYLREKRDEGTPGSEVFAGLRVRLRPVKEDDIEQLLKWDSDEEITRWTGKHFDNSEDARAWYLHNRHPFRRTMVIELDDGRPIGEVEVVNIAWRSGIAEIRVVIGDKSLWNRGLGRDAVYTFVRGLFQTTSLREIFLRVDSNNVRARRCYRKVGFRAQGRVWVPGESGAERSRCLILMSITQDELEQRLPTIEAKNEATEAWM